MAANFFVVINQEDYPSDAKSKTAPIASCEIMQPGLRSAKVVKVTSNAGTVAEAIAIVTAAYPQLVTSPPIVVTEAQWKES